ncbi:MAG TPA: ATP synthase F1 subunit gamma [Bacteroidia bacterium]|nr:ATP synthase F1 subunit gamma [Bacteroidia bacterium]
MASLKEVRNRIVSVSSTQQITSAMKMVSAAKLRRAQDAVTQMRPYANKMREILENLSGSLSNSEGVFSQEREVKNVLLVVITSNRGLCGGFNSNVIKRAMLATREEFAGAKISYLAIGKKGADFFRKTTFTSAFKHVNPNSLIDQPIYANVIPVAQDIMDAFAAGTYDKVMLFYNQFKNAAVQITQAEQFLPVVAPKTAGKKRLTADYIFEPSREEIVLDLIPRSLKTQLYKATLDSIASEHGARMTAMHKATDNAQELIRALKISYNKARQAAITNEILEIVGGAEALAG